MENADGNFRWASHNTLASWTNWYTGQPQSEWSHTVMDNRGFWWTKDPIHKAQSLCEKENAGNKAQSFCEKENAGKKTT